MKHIILQLLDKAMKSTELFRGLDSSWAKNNCVIVDVMQAKDEMFSKISEQLAWGRYQVNSSPNWENIIECIIASFLISDNRIQLDLLVDAKGAAIALQVMKDIQKVFTKRGIIISTKLIFLAEIRSQFYQNEQRLYDEIKQTIEDRENGSPVNYWNCIYLLIVSNDHQKTMRNILLPYLLQFDCSSNDLMVKIFGAQIRDMDIKSLDRIPMELSTMVACHMLNRKSKIDPLSLLLMNENVNGLSSGEQLSTFQTELNRMESIQYPLPVDLLVQKNSPLGDISTRDLFNRFCLDNPQSDPAYYESADENALSQMPLIARAVSKWEEQVVEKGCTEGDLSLLIDMLGSNSVFDRLLRGYQKPKIMNTEKELTGKDGYTEVSIKKLESYTNELQKILDNAIFEARIKLIRSRMHILQNELILIRKDRQKAIDSAMEESQIQSIIDMIKTWSEKINSDLCVESSRMVLPGPSDDPAIWIRRCAEEMLNRIEPPDLDKGRKELYESCIRIIDNMSVHTDDILISPLLNSYRKLSDNWIVYKEINLNRECIRSEEPVVIKLSEYELNLQDPGIYDQQIFVSAPTPPTISSDYTDNEDYIDNESEMNQEQLSDYKDKQYEVFMDKDKQYEVFMGTLEWTWDNMDYGNARIEVYADTGILIDKERPVFEKTIKRRSDGMYSIGAENKFPSGVLLTFRIIYQDGGRDVNNIINEIQMRAKKTALKVTRVKVVEGKKMGLFGGKPYMRLKITPYGPFDPKHVVVASSSGHFYSASWTKIDSEGSWLSELLPYMDEWSVVDRPGDKIVYQIIH